MPVIFQRKFGKEIISFCVLGNFKFPLASFFFFSKEKYEKRAFLNTVDVKTY